MIVNMYHFFCLVECRLIYPQNILGSSHGMPTKVVTSAVCDTLNLFLVPLIAVRRAGLHDLHWEASCR